MRILIVEDEASLRAGIADLLAGDGHEVTTVADGMAGIEAGLRGPFHVVVLDLMLPRLDGMEVCRRLRAARPGMPILMLTACSSEDDKVRGLVEGADDYVTKPFSARELLARVRAVGRRAPPGESLDEVEVDGAVIDLARMAIIRRARPPLDRLGASLEIDIPRDLRAQFDRDALARIVSNLLDNAEKYARHAADRAIQLTARDSGDVVEVSVSDRGPGVRDSSKLFKVFSRGINSNDAPAGLGLGLALSRSLARAMGGDLTYRPRDGGGATFVLQLRRGKAEG